jgi:hypothetical protein
VSLYDDDRGGLPSASGVYRIANCWGSYLFESLFPDTESEYDGEFLHAVTVDDDDIAKCNLEQREVVLKAQAITRGIIDDTIGTYDKKTKEDRLWIHHKLKAILSGRYDMCYSRKLVALVIDYKFGWADVSPADSNYQLRALVVMLWLAFGFEEIYAAIISPRTLIKDTIVHYRLADIEQSHKEITGISIRAMKPNQPLCAGPWCDYCKARHVCPKAWEKAG